MPTTAPTPSATPTLTPTPTLIATATPTPAPAIAPVVLSAVEAEALLHENAAKVRDEFVRVVQYCGFTYAYAGWPTDRRIGWTTERRIVMRGERLSPSYRSGRPDTTDDAADRIPEYDHDIDYDPAEWFGEEHRRFMEGEPRGTYVGQFTYLRQPSLRYETRVEHGGGADEPVATVLQIDYLVENPYVFIENEYSVFKDSTRQLERQFTQYQYELTDCTQSGSYDDTAVAVRRELSERAVELYAPIRDGAYAGCSLTFRRDGMQWRDFRGDSHPDGPIESEARDVIARNGEGLWQPTGEEENRHNGRVVSRTKNTPEGIWVFLPQNGEWRKVASPGSVSYQNPLEYLAGRITSVGVLVNQQGFPISPGDGRVYDYPYAGKTEIDGRTAVRYEKASVSEGVGSAEDIDLGQEGLEFHWSVYEFFEDDPLQSRRSTYDILPDGEIVPYTQSTVGAIELQDCPGSDDEAPTPTPATEGTTGPTRSPEISTPAPSPPPGQETEFLYETAARIRDELTRDVEHCELVYTFAEWPGDWVLTQRMHTRYGGLSRGSRNSSYDDSDGYEEWIPDHESREDNDAAEWFAAEYHRLLDNAPRGEYVGQSSHLGRPALRYESRIEHETGSNGDMRVATLITLDYLIENPFVFIEHEYSIFADGTRKLVRQFTRSEFGLGGCTGGAKQDVDALEVRRELVRNAATAYAPVRDAIFAGCQVTLTTTHGRWRVLEDMEQGEPETEGTTRSTFTSSSGGSWRIASVSEYRQADGTFDSHSSDSTIDDPLDRLAWSLRFAVGIGGLIDLDGFPQRYDGRDRWLDYRYAGITEIDGLFAVRFEQYGIERGSERFEHRGIEVDSELRQVLWSLEYVKDNPLLYRWTYSYVLPDGGLQIASMRAVTDVSVGLCPSQE